MSLSTLLRPWRRETARWTVTLHDTTNQDSVFVVRSPHQTADNASHQSVRVLHVDSLNPSEFVPLQASRMRVAATRLGQAAIALRSEANAQELSPSVPSNQPPPPPRSIPPDSLAAASLEPPEPPPEPPPPLSSEDRHRIVETAVRALFDIPPSGTREVGSQTPRPLSCPRPASELHELICVALDESERVFCITAPSEFFCPLSLHALRDPVVASDGHFYERLYIRKHIDGGKAFPTSPLTNEPFQSSKIFPCFSIKSLMELWVVDKLGVRAGDSVAATLRTRIALAC